MGRFNKFNRDDDFESKEGAVESVHFKDGKVVVPPEHEEYYTQTWKWKLLMGLPLEPYKLKYLLEYEEKFGVITQRKKLDGIYVDLPLSRENRNG